VVYNEDNTVIGLVSSGYDPKFTNSIAFAIPISMFRATEPLNPLEITPTTRVLRLPSLGIMYHNSTEAGIVYSDQDCEKGVNVQWVSKYSALFEHVHPGDKLCSIKIVSTGEELKIDHVGEVQVPWYNTKIPLSHALSIIPVNTPIQLKYWTSSSVQVLTTTLKHSFRGAFQTVYYPFETLDYETFGGLVVMPLRSIHMAFYPFLSFKLSPTDKEQEQLVISYVLPNSLMAQSDVFFGGEILQGVNGIPVKTMEEYRKSLETPLNGTHQHLEWITIDHAKVDLALNKLLEEAPTLQNSYHYPISPVYQHYIPTTTTPTQPPPTMTTQPPPTMTTQPLPSSSPLPPTTTITPPTMTTQPPPSLPLPSPSPPLPPTTTTTTPSPLR
jgi:hypothetical protein